MYILDEVDAALDLSHTQNIGTMLRTHFRDSQFLIVSLKEGMFNNANVIFRTRFVDGVSAVTRTVTSRRAAAAAAAVAANTANANSRSNANGADDGDGENESAVAVALRGKRGKRRTAKTTTTTTAAAAAATMGK